MASSAGTLQSMGLAAGTSAGLSQSVHVTSTSATATSAVLSQTASSSTDMPDVAVLKALTAASPESTGTDVFKLDKMD